MRDIFAILQLCPLCKYSKNGKVAKNKKYLKRKLTDIVIEVS
tara:strand:- start:685 stop:810 length:126 start_codon:yes stop_codon:yes gene_type:complete